MFTFLNDKSTAPPPRKRNPERPGQRAGWRLRDRRLSAPVFFAASNPLKQTAEIIAEIVDAAHDRDVTFSCRNRLEARADPTVPAAQAQVQVRFGPG